MRNLICMLCMLIATLTQLVIPRTFTLLQCGGKRNGIDQQSVVTLNRDRYDLLINVPRTRTGICHVDKEEGFMDPSK